MRALLTALALSFALPMAACSRDASEAESAATIPVTIAMAGKAHRFVRVGDRIAITRPSGTRQIVSVLGLAEHSLPKADARGLYDDHTPRPSTEEVALRRAERVFRAAQAAAGPPDKRQRRALRRARGY